MARDIPWLREDCGKILYELASSLESPVPVIDGILDRLKASNLLNTPEGVAIWLMIRTNFPSAALPPNVWHDNDPLSKKERTRLAKILKEDFRGSSTDGASGSIKTAATNPNPIFAWDVVLKEMLGREEAQKTRKKDDSKAEFAQFWIDVVDSRFLVLDCCTAADLFR